MPMNKTTLNILFPYKILHGWICWAGDTWDFTWLNTQVPQRISIQSHPSLNRILGFEHASQTNDRLPIRAWGRRTQSPVEPGSSFRCIQSRQSWSNPGKERKNVNWDVLVSFPKSICILTYPLSLFFVETNDVLWTQVEHALATNSDANTF